MIYPYFFDAVIIAWRLHIGAKMVFRRLFRHLTSKTRFCLRD